MLPARSVATAVKLYWPPMLKPPVEVPFEYKFQPP